MSFIYDKKNDANACGVKELKTHILTFTFETIPTKFLFQKKEEKSNFASVVMKMKLKQLIKKVIFEEILDKKFELLKVLNL